MIRRIYFFTVSQKKCICNVIL